jgi:hypothetical protein
MSNTNITTTTETTTVTVTENVVEIELNNAGVQGIPGVKGDTGDTGATGPKGDKGDTGAGVASGGTAGQILAKVDGTNFNTTWIDNAAEQTLYLVRNNTGTTILKGTLLAASGAEPSGRIDVEPFVVTGLEDSELRVMGMATANISNGVNGTVMSFGTLKNIDTRGNFASALAVGDETWAEGDILFAHPTVAGKLTKVRPQHDLAVAFITVRNATAGQIAIRIVPGNFHLEWLHDVSITSPTNNQVLTYDSASSLWVNANNPADGVTSITATAPLTGGTITSTGSIGLDQTALSITRSQVSDFTSGTVAQAGTATYAVNSGTAIYADTSGTAVSVSGSAITQSQIVNLVSDLAGKANLAGGNAFTGAQTVTASAIGQVPLTLVAASGQTANLLATAGGARIPAAGNYFIAPGITASYAADFTAGNATTVPVTIKGAASQSASLTAWQNSAGSLVATMSAAGDLALYGNGITSGDHRVGTATYLSATLNVAARSTTEKGIVVRGQASQTANLQEWQASNGTSAIFINGAGELNTGYAFTRFGGGGSSSGLVNIHPTNNIIALAVRGASGQSSNLQEWQNSAGTILHSINSAGLVSGTRAHTITQTNAGEFLLRLVGASGQTGDFMQINNSSAQTLINVTSAGNLNATGQVRVGTTSGLGQLSVVSVNSANVGAVVRGASSQTANLQEWQNSAGSILGRFEPAGDMVITGAIRSLYYTNRNNTGAYADFSTDVLSVVQRIAGTVAFSVKGASGQTANLQEWHNSAGTVLANVTPSGQSRATDFRTLNTLAVLREISGGGNLLFSRTTSATSSPGADRAMLYVVTGTNAGTLKLVVRAGASGAETTILDNIPT